MNRLSDELIIKIASYLNPYDLHSLQKAYPNTKRACLEITKQRQFHLTKFDFPIIKAFWLHEHQIVLLVKVEDQFMIKIVQEHDGVFQVISTFPSPLEKGFPQIFLPKTDLHHQPNNIICQCLHDHYVLNQELQIWKKTTNPFHFSCEDGILNVTESSTNTNILNSICKKVYLISEEAIVFQNNLNSHTLIIFYFKTRTIELFDFKNFKCFEDRKNVYLSDHFLVIDCSFINPNWIVVDLEERRRCNNTFSFTKTIHHHGEPKTIINHILILRDMNTIILLDLKTNTHIGIFNANAGIFNGLFNPRFQKQIQFFDMDEKTQKICMTTLDGTLITGHLWGNDNQIYTRDYFLLFVLAIFILFIMGTLHIRTFLVKKINDFIFYFLVVAEAPAPAAAMIF